MNTGRLSVIGCACAWLMWSAISVAAAEYSWVSGGSDNKWTTPGNWQGGTGFPGAAGDVATLNAADTVRLDTNGVVTLGRLQLTSSTPKTVRIDADQGAAFSLSGLPPLENGFRVDGHADNRLVIDPDIVLSIRTDKVGAGTVEFTGAVTNTANVHIYLGQGTCVFSGTASLNFPLGAVGIGNGSEATVILTNQAAWSGKELNFGTGSSASTKGIMIQDSDDCSVTLSGQLKLGNLWSQGTTNGNYYLRKGTLIASTISLGYSAPCRFWQSGGSFMTPGAPHIKNGEYLHDGGQATLGGMAVGDAVLQPSVTLAGGRMTLNGSITTPGTPVMQAFNFSGGVLQADSSCSSDIPMRLSGAPTIDTPAAGTTFTPSMGITGSASLIKTGAGTLTLAGANQLSGSIVVSNGLCALAAASVLESHAHSTEPLGLKICSGAVFRLTDINSVVTVPVALDIEAGGKINFYNTGSAYNRGVLVAHSIITNGVPLPPGRYTKDNGFITAFNTAASVVVPTVWTGAGDGVSWSDTANWKGCVVPNGTAAAADLSNARGSVRLDSEVTLTGLVYNPQGSERSLTLTGSGSLTLNVATSFSAGLVVGPGRTLTFNVPLERSNGTFTIIGGGSVIVKKGFPSVGAASGPAFALYGDLIFAGQTAIADTLSMWRHELNSIGSVVFTNGCQLTCKRILNNPAGFYAVRQILHDGGDVTCGDVFFTRHNGAEANPYTYFMRSGTLTTTNPSGINIGVYYAGSWIRYSGGAFVMSGGTVNSDRLAMGLPDNVIDLHGGTLNIGAGGVISTTNDQGTVRLGGVSLCAAANWSSSLNMVLSGENGPTLLDTQGRTATLSGALSGPGGLAKTGAGTLNLNGATNTFTGPLVVAGGELVCGAASVFNGVTDLTVTNGTLRINGEVLSDGITVRVGGTGSLLVAAGRELVVDRLYQDGAPRPAGSYTFGEGTVTVRQYTGIVWTGDANDGALWSTLGNWTNTASVPNGSDVQLDLGFSQFETSDQIVLDVTPGATLAGLAFDQGAQGCTLTITCPALVTNTLTFATNGTVYVAEGQTLVLDTDVFLNGDLVKTGLGTLVLDRSTASADANGDFRFYIREGRVVNRGAISQMAVQPATASRHVPPPEYVQEGPRAVMQNRVMALPGYWAGFGAERGVFVQRGGVVDLTTPSVAFYNVDIGFIIAGSTGTEGRYELEGGELITCPTLPAYVSGNNAHGIFCQSGGTSTFYRLTLSRPYNMGFGEVLLSNGTLRVNGTVTKGKNDGRVELSGGRIETLADGIVFAPDVPVALATGPLGGVAFAQVSASSLSTLSGTLGGSGCLIQDGPGMLLMNGINAFSGGLAVRGGTLQVASPLQGVTDVWADGGTLELSAPVPSLTNLAVRAAGAFAVIGATATPFPSGVTLNLAAGSVTELDFAGVVDVDRLVLDGQPKSPGLYGGPESSAPLKPSSAYFSGTGALNVLYGPPPSGTAIFVR